MSATPKPSRAVYVRRRLVVGLIAAGLVGGAVVAVQVIGSDDDDVSDATESSVSVSADSTSTVVGDVAMTMPTTETVTSPSSPASVDTTATSATTVASTAVTTVRPTTDAPTSTTTNSGGLPVDPDAPVVDAAAYGIYDLNSGTWLTATNADAARPVGSIMKLLTAYVVMQAGDPAKVVTVPNLSLDPMESAIGLYPGEKLPRDVLLRAMLIVSANDAAEALAVDVGGTREQFIAMMNDAADELGLDGTVASNPSGLDGNGAVSTVRDILELTKVLMQDTTFRATVARTSANLHGQTFPATNELLGTYSGADGVKTGSTTQAGYGVVASATRAARTLIVVVLGAPTDQARFVAAAALLDWAFANP